MILPNMKKTALGLTPAVFLILIAFDRLLKSAALGDYFEPPIVLLPGLLKLDFIGNENIAFSLPFRGPWLNLLIALAIAALIYAGLIFFRRKKVFYALIFWLIILGAASNFFDRLRYGFVIDYFDVSFFTVFNLADAMIAVGALAVVFLEWRAGRRV